MIIDNKYINNHDFQQSNTDLYSEYIVYTFVITSEQHIQAMICRDTVK